MMIIANPRLLENILSQSIPQATIEELACNYKNYFESNESFGQEDFVHSIASLMILALQT